MQRTTIALATLAVILAGIAFFQGGTDHLLAGLANAGRVMAGVSILLVAAFSVSGLIQTVVTREMASAWLGKGSGWRGLLVAGIAGALIPGGPYVYYPIAISLLLAGAEIGTVVTFVTAKNLWTLSRLPLEIALLGPRLTLVRYLTTFLFPPAMGFLAQTFFPGVGDELRTILERTESAGAGKKAGDGA